MTTWDTTERVEESDAEDGRRAIISRLCGSSEDCVRMSLKIDWSLWDQPSSPKSDSDCATDGRFR